MSTLNLTSQIEADESQERKLPNVIYAGFWRRLAAYICDELLRILLWGMLSLFFIALRTSPPPKEMLIFTEFLLPLTFMWLYYAFWESSRFQASPGKLLMRIYVTDLDHQPISFWRAIVRTMLKGISGAILGLGFLAIFFTPHKQGLHDEITRCLILRKRVNEEQIQTTGVESYLLPD
ncbi:MAG: RDD family protein [Caldilineaceae bacterium]